MGSRGQYFNTNLQLSRKRETFEIKHFVFESMSLHVIANIYWPSVAFLQNKHRGVYCTQLGSPIQQILKALPSILQPILQSLVIVTLVDLEPRKNYNLETNEIVLGGY